MRRYPQQNNDFQMRPLFRLLAALILVALALVFGSDVAQLSAAESVVFSPDRCSGRSGLICEIGNWIGGAIPDHIQLPLEIAARIVASLSLVYLALRILWPLLFRRSSST
jgi:hypothetical protein